MTVGNISVRGRLGCEPGRVHRLDAVDDANECVLDGAENAGAGLLAAAPLGDVVLQHLLEAVDAPLAACIRRHRCGEPACCALGGGVDERHDGVLAQRGGVCARPLLRPLERARQLAQLAVHRVETRELLAHRLEVLRQLHDMRVDELQSRVVGARGHVAERAVETPLEQVEAPIQGSKRRCRVDVSQRALQQGGDVGKARLEPGLIMGRHGLQSSRLCLSRPSPSCGPPCRLPGAREFCLCRLVGPHQVLGRLGVPRLLCICRHGRCGEGGDARLPLPVQSESGDPLRQAGDALLDAAQGLGPLLRQPVADLAEQLAELDQALLHVGDGIAVVRRMLLRVALLGGGHGDSLAGGKCGGNACPRARPASGGPVG